MTTVIERRNGLGRHIGRWVLYTGLIGKIEEPFVCINSIRRFACGEQIAAHVWLDIADFPNMRLRKGQAIAFYGKAGTHLSSGVHHGHGALITHGIEQIRQSFLLRKVARADVAHCVHVWSLDEIPLAPGVRHLITLAIKDATLPSFIVTAGDKEYRLWLKKEQ